MWSEKDITIGKTKHHGNVNVSDSHVEIELPYFNNWMNCLNEVIAIGKDSYKITNLTNVGDRDEVIRIVINMENKNDEYKSDKSRKNS